MNLFVYAVAGMVLGQMDVIQAGLTDCSDGTVNNWDGIFDQCVDNSLIQGIAVYNGNPKGYTQHCCKEVDEVQVNNPTDCAETQGAKFGFDFCPAGKLPSNVCNVLTKTDRFHCVPGADINLNCCTYTTVSGTIRPTSDCSWLFGRVGERLLCPKDRVLVGEYGSINTASGSEARAVGIYCCTYTVA